MARSIEPKKEKLKGAEAGYREAVELSTVTRVTRCTGTGLKQRWRIASAASERLASTMINAPLICAKMQNRTPLPQRKQSCRRRRRTGIAVKHLQIPAAVQVSYKSKPYQAVPSTHRHCRQNGPNETPCRSSRWYKTMPATELPRAARHPFRLPLLGFREPCFSCFQVAALQQQLAKARLNQTANF